MAISVPCSCGKTFSLKDELAGKLVQCPQCNAQLRVPGGTDGGVIQPGLDPVFQRKKFLLRQKHLAISEKYYVWDETGNTILFIERPAHLMMSCLAVLAAFVAAAIVATIFGVLAGLCTGGLQGVFGVLAAFGGLAALICTLILLVPKRHVYIYRDDSKRELLLQVDQDKKFTPIVATYTVKNATGTCLANLKKNYLYNFFRKRWYCFSPTGRLISVIKEDSLILSLLRRFLGSLYGILRTNFVFLKEDGEQIIGEFNRKFTLLDRYVLDMSRDVENHLDPRLAVAIGVMLDTGERR
ncbi:MAG: hypothetical protein HYY16_06630 [Planctomycetes bacterium]|nr:hypothetical protein [Planctomycetota bacterium]